MKTIALLMFACLLPLAAWGHQPPHNPAAFHLKFSNGAIHAHGLWTKGPLQMEESLLQIHWMNGDKHSPMELPGTFAVAIAMPSMPEMNNPPVLFAPLLDQKGKAQLGAYRVYNIYFTMEGDWELQITVTYPDGTKETQAIALKL